MKHKKGREIERKFLIKRLPLQILHSRHYPLRQGYLATEPRGRHVRLRKKGKTMSLTFKVSRGRGATREEHEIRLSSKQFEILWSARKSASRGLYSSDSWWNQPEQAAATPGSIQIDQGDAGFGKF